MPEGTGLHPAFWLLGSNIKTVGYPKSGEIDVMELVNTGRGYHNAIHGPLLDDSSKSWKQSFDDDAPVNLSNDFHVFQVYRKEGLIRVGIDGKQVGEYSRDNMPPNAEWVFDGPMYVTLNVAVGGTWPGPVKPSTKFPAAMFIDWIRYWQ